MFFRQKKAGKYTYLQVVENQLVWIIRGERLPNEQQDKVPSGSEAEKEPQRGTPPAIRCTKDLVEEALFKSRRNLFSSLSLVFFDTTSIYFEGEGGGEEFGKRGNSKDHRPDLKQMVVGMVLAQDGFPILSETNTDFSA